MKKEVDDGVDFKLAKFMKALSHPTRIAIIRRLVHQRYGYFCSCREECEVENCKCGCRCGELVEMFPISQSTVSQHIKELKLAGLIKVNRRKSEYTLNHSQLSEGLILLQDLLGQSKEIKMENRNCNCGSDCQCGDNCQCGPDCQCKNGGECTCGSNCNC